MLKYEDVKTEVDIISKQIARDYPDIDWQDIRQEIALFIVENGKSIKSKSEGGNPRKFLHLVGNNYAKKLRTQHMVLTPQYAYRPNDVKLILENAFFGPDKSAYVPDDARSPLSKTFNSYDPAGGFSVQDVDPFHEADYLEISSDVLAALKKLKPEQKEAIFRRYALQEVPENNSWERKRLNNAINELTRKLNWYRGTDPDRRVVGTNAAARVRISRTYDE